MAPRCLPRVLHFLLMQTRFSHVLPFLHQLLYHFGCQPLPRALLFQFTARKHAPLTGCATCFSSGLFLLTLFIIYPVLSFAGSREDIASRPSNCLTFPRPGPPIPVAVLAAAESSGRRRRLPEQFRVLSPLSFPTPVLVWPSPLPLGSPSLMGSRLLSLSENEAEHTVSKVSATKFLTKNSSEVSPSGHQNRGAPPSSNLFLQPRFGEEPSRIYTVGDTASNDKGQTNKDSQTSTSLLAEVRKGSKKTAASQEPVAAVNSLSLQTAPVGPPVVSAHGRQNMTVHKGTQTQVQQDAPPETQEEPPHAAEASALLGFINESPYHEKLRQQTFPASPEYARVTIAPVTIFRDTRAPPPLARTHIHDYASRSAENPPSAPSAVFESHFKIGTLAHSGLKKKSDLNTAIPSAVDTDVPSPQQDGSSSRVSPLGEDHGETQRKVSSVTVEFNFRPSRSPASMYTVLPVFSSPLSISTAPQSVAASTLPPTPSPSSLSPPHSSPALLSPLAYVPALYLIPFVIGERSHPPPQAAVGSEHMSGHPATFSHEASPITALSQIHEEGTSKSFALEHEEKALQNSGNFLYSRAATPASTWASAATTAHQSTTVDPLPRPSPSMFLSGMSSSPSGKHKTPREGLPSPRAASDERGYFSDASALQCGGSIVSPELSESGKSAHTVKQVHASPTSRTPPERTMNFLPTLLPSPRSPRSWWTRMFQVARSTPKGISGALLSQNACAPLVTSELKNILTQRSTVEEIAPELSSPPSAVGAAEANYMLPSFRDIQVLPDATIHSAASPYVQRGKGGLSYSATRGAHYETAAENESFPGGYPPTISSDWPHYTGVGVELTNDAKPALYQIIGLLTLITGIGPGSLLNFFIGTSKRAEPVVLNNKMSRLACRDTPPPFF